MKKKGKKEEGRRKKERFKGRKKKGQKNMKNKFLVESTHLNYVILTVTSFAHLNPICLPLIISTSILTVYLFIKVLIL